VDENAWVLVVTGAGERSFCVGGDLTMLLDSSPTSHGPGPHAATWGDRKGKDISSLIPS